MSNPAVLILADASNRKEKIKRFVIEDNIGESIHLHIDNMRVDFTIKEFLDFSEMVRDSLINLDFLHGYKLESFDEHFLKECAVFLPKLKSIQIEEIELSKLRCIVNLKYRSDLSFMKLARIDESPAYKYLQGDKHDFLNYFQFNYIGNNNEKRLLGLVKSEEKNGYPFDEKHIILFNGENIIRDGQHRAAVLASRYGLNYKFKVMRFNFEGNSHNISKLNNLKVFMLWLSKKIYRKLKKIYKDE
jgi:hypothetical protein